MKSIITTPYTNAAFYIIYVLVYVIISTALFLTRSRNLAAILLMIYLVLILLTAQALTLSRGGWISTIGAIVFMIMVLLSQRRFQSKRLYHRVLPPWSRQTRARLTVSTSLLTAAQDGFCLPLTATNSFVII